MCLSHSCLHDGRKEGLWVEQTAEPGHRRRLLGAPDPVGKLREPRLPNKQRVNNTFFQALADAVMLLNVWLELLSRRPDVKWLDVFDAASAELELVRQPQCFGSCIRRRHRTHQRAKNEKRVPPERVAGIGNRGILLLSPAGWRARGEGIAWKGRPASPMRSEPGVIPARQEKPHKHARFFCHRSNEVARMHAAFPENQEEKESLNAIFRGGRETNRAIPTLEHLAKGPREGQNRRRADGTLGSRVGEHTVLCSLVEAGNSARTTQ